MKTIKFITATAVLLAFCAAAYTDTYKADKYLLSVLSLAKQYNDQYMSYEKPEPFKIYDTGTEEWVDYSKYGEFQNPGTPEYKHVVKDLEGLKAASGEGIYPNNQSVQNSPDYKKLKLKGSKWNFVNSDNYQANFYRWASEKDISGESLYYTALALEKSGNYKHAVKAYYACLVFFPDAVSYTQWKTPWYIAPVCLAKIRYLTRTYPEEIGVKIEGASTIIKNAFDNDEKNDVFNISPGKLVKASPEDFAIKYVDLAKSGIKQVTGKGRVKLIRYNNDNFQLTVDGKPYVVRGMNYSPSKIGLSPDFGTLNNARDWMFDDYNKNGMIDGPYDAYVDANRNDKKDEGEYVVGDFALMKEMGVNTLRLIHYDGLNKKLLMEGYKNFGLMYTVGNLIGMYAVDSGADWYTGTDYTDKEQRQSMLDSVRRMVEEYKDEPYVLIWVLGNENNYGSIGVQGESVGSACLAQKQPDAYYSFVNECAKLIKSLDPQQRPVAICNGDLYLLDYCAKNAPDIDVYGVNAYRGDFGFGQLWADVLREYDRPVLITEYGCPAYAKGWSAARAEAGQAEYLKNCWKDVEYNLGGVEGGAGNALGAMTFEWTDEWWKAGYTTSPDEHDTTSQWNGPFLDGGAYEEWFGICALGNGTQSPFKRQLRKSYFMYRDLWQKYRE